jgi:hypothetical protein
VRFKNNARQTQGFVVRPQKNARQTILYHVYFFCRAPYIKRTAKRLFAVRPKENTRQRFSRTAKGSFPVVSDVDPNIDEGNWNLLPTGCSVMV